MKLSKVKYDQLELSIIGGELEVVVADSNEDIISYDVYLPNGQKLYDMFCSHDKLIESINEDITFFWVEYTKCDNAILSEKALELKRKMLDNFVES